MKYYSICDIYTIIIDYWEYKIWNRLQFLLQTCGGDAVKPHEGVETRGGAREHAGDPKRHEAPLSQGLHGHPRLR